MYTATADKKQTYTKLPIGPKILTKRGKGMAITKLSALLVNATSKKIAKLFKLTKTQ